MSSEFEGKVVLVTGSSSGIGESTVKLFAAAGAKVVVTGRNAERIANVAKACEALSPKGLKPLEIVCDMKKEDEVDQLIKSVVSHFGRLDVLVNNAGAGFWSNCSSPDALEKFDQCMQINLRAPFQLCWRAIPHLAETKGAIVNVSSICALKPYDHSVSYCIAKCGLDMLTRWLAVDCGPKGIRVNSVCPAQIDTPIFTNDGLPKEKLDAMWAAVRKEYPLKREGYPDDIANAIYFLSSDKSSFITGVMLKLDGGFMDAARLAWA